MTHKDALKIIKEMADDNNTWNIETYAALRYAAKYMDSTCTCGYEIKAYCTKCGGYVAVGKQ